MKRDKMELSSNHKRILSVTARQVETTLNEMEEILKGKLSKNKTAQIIPDYNEEKRNELLKVIERIRTENERMFDELSLKPLELTEERVIKAKSANLWTILIDSSSVHLKNYGALPDEKAAEIDFHIDNLLTSLEILMKTENA